jgi:hypothetical protein
LAIPNSSRGKGRKTLLITGIACAFCVVLVAVWWFFFERVDLEKSRATINAQLAAVNAQVPPSTGGTTAAPSNASGVLTVAGYAGKMPDQAFWAELRPLFSGTILGGGRSGSEVFGEFYANQDMYIFTPCEYDENTKTITVTWKSKTPEPSEEGCTNCQFLGSHAVSIDVSKPENGIVANLGSSDEHPSIEFLTKDMPSVDANSVKTHNFSSLPPALAKWATALIQATRHPVDVEVTVIQ